MIAFRSTALFLAFSVLSVGAVSQPVAHHIDPTHTDVIASWNHFGFSNPSLHMGDAKGTIWFDQETPSNSRVEVELPLSRLNTHIPALNDHLMGKDFFDAGEHPSVFFRSHNVKDLGNGRLEIHGEVEVRGKRHPVVLQAKTNGIGKHPMSGKPTIGFDATTTISRSALGMDGFVPAIGDKVNISITTEASAEELK